MKTINRFNFLLFFSILFLFNCNSEKNGDNNFLENQKKVAKQKEVGTKKILTKKRKQQTLSDINTLNVNKLSPAYNQLSQSKSTYDPNESKAIEEEEEKELKGHKKGFNISWKGNEYVVAQSLKDAINASEEEAILYFLCKMNKIPYEKDQGKKSAMNAVLSLISSPNAADLDTLFMLQPHVYSFFIRVLFKYYCLNMMEKNFNVKHGGMQRIEGMKNSLHIMKKWMRSHTYGSNQPLYLESTYIDIMETLAKTKLIDTKQKLSYLGTGLQELGLSVYTFFAPLPRYGARAKGLIKFLTNAFQDLSNKNKDEIILKIYIASTVLMLENNEKESKNETLFGTGTDYEAEFRAQDLAESKWLELFHIFSIPIEATPFDVLSKHKIMNIFLVFNFEILKKLLSSNKKDKILSENKNENPRILKLFNIFFDIIKKYKAGNIGYAKEELKLTCQLLYMLTVYLKKNDKKYIFNLLDGIQNKVRDQSTISKSLDKRVLRNKDQIILNERVFATSNCNDLLKSGNISADDIKRFIKTQGKAQQFKKSPVEKKLDLVVKLIQNLNSKFDRRFTAPLVLESE